MKTDFKRKISLFMAIVMMICTMSNISIMAEPNDGDLSTEIISEEIDNSSQSEDMDIIDNEETSQEEVSEEEVAEEPDSAVSENEDLVLFAADTATTPAAVISGVKLALNDSLEFPRNSEEIQQLSKLISDYGISVSDIQWKLMGASVSGTKWTESPSAAKNAKFYDGSQEKGTTIEGTDKVTVKTADTKTKGYFILKAVEKTSQNSILKYTVTIEGKKATSIALTPAKTSKTNGLSIKDKTAAIKEYDLSMVVAKDQVLTNTSIITVTSTVGGTGVKTSEMQTTLTGSAAVLDINTLEATKTGYSRFQIKALKSGSGDIEVYSTQKDLRGRPEQKAIIHVTVSEYPDTATVNPAAPLHIRAGEKIEFEYSKLSGASYQIEGESKVLIQDKSLIDANVKKEDIKWVIHNGSSKASTAAKFETINSKKKPVPVSTITGKDSVKLISTKANRTLNNLIHVKAVNILQPGVVYADFQVAIRPTMIDELTVGPKSTSKKKGVDPIDGKTDEYNLELNMGSKFKLTATPKSTSKAKVYNTGVRYEVVSGSASTITVSNTGIINPIASTSTGGTIKISTLETFDGTNIPVKEARVYVKINPTVNKLMLNATSLTMAPNSSQRFILATSPISTYNAKVKVDYVNTAVTLYEAGTNTVVAPGQIVTVNGVKPFEVRVNSGIETKELFATPEIKFEYQKDATGGLTDGSKAKPVTVKLKFAPILGNITKINQKFKPTNGFVTLNIPVGVPTDLKVSVTPASAFNEIDWVLTGSSFDLGNLSDVSNYIEVRNGWVIPKEVTPTPIEIAGVAQGVTSTGNKLSTYTYKINVYRPTSIIGVTADSASPDYTLYAGYLMDKNVTLTTNDPLIEGGKWINLKTIRSNGSTEKITWTSNNTSAVTINQPSGDDFSIYLNSPGTYVITGTSEFSKLKYSFRVKVKEVYSKDKVEDIKKPENSEKKEVLYQYIGDPEWLQYSDANPIEARVGQKIQLATTIENEIAAKLKWSLDTSAKGFVSITSKGLVTPVKYTSTPVKVNYTYYSSTKGLKDQKIEGTVLIKVFDPDVTTTITSNVPAFASKDVALKLKSSVKGTKANLVKTTFYYSKDGGAKQSIDSDNIFKPGQKGQYQIWAESTSTNDSTVVLDVTARKNIKLLEVMVNKATITTPTINAVQKPGAQPQTFEVSVLADAKAEDMTNGKTPDVEGIVWSSSNYNVAYATEITTTNGAYATAQITIGANAVGKATITGTLNNSGKKVKVVVNTVAGSDIVAPSKVAVSVTPYKTIKVDNPAPSDPENPGKIPVKTVYMESGKTVIGKITPSVSDKTKKLVPGQVVWYVDATGGQNYTKYDYNNPDPNLPIEIDRLGKIKLKANKTIGTDKKISITAGYEYKDPTTGQMTEIMSIKSDDAATKNNYYQLRDK